jgi:hypothetical protein
VPSTFAVPMIRPSKGICTVSGNTPLLAFLLRPYARRARRLHRDRVVDGTSNTNCFRRRHGVMVSLDNR